MTLGYDSHDSSESNGFEKQGISGGVVHQYSMEKMKFPCFILRSTADNKVGKHKIQVLKNMLNTVVSYSNPSDADMLDNFVYVYFNQDGKTVRIGRLMARQVKSFLQLFNDNYVDCYMDIDTELKGNNRYILSDMM